MDTNISDADLAHSGVGLTAPLGLPGEGNGASEPHHHFQEPQPISATAYGLPPITPAGEPTGKGEPPEMSQAHGSIGPTPDARMPTSSRKSRRRSLLAGVAVILLLGVGAAGYVYRLPLHDMAISKGLIAAATDPNGHLSAASGPMHSTGNHLEPATAAVASTRTPVRDVGVPAGTQAMPAKPTISTTGRSGASEAGILPGKSGPVVQRQQPADPVPVVATEMQEIAGLKLDPRLDAAPGVAVVAKPSNEMPKTQKLPDIDVGRPAAIPASSPVVGNEAVVSTPTLVANKPLATDISIPWHVPQLVVTPVPVPVVIPSSAQPALAKTASTAPAIPADPIATAATLQAAPLSTTQQVQLLDLVKNLGAQLRDTRTEVTQLRATVVQLSGTVENKINDFDGRLSMAEATTILQSSARAGAPTETAPAPAMPVAPSAHPSSMVVPSKRVATRLSVSADAPAASTTQPAERRVPKDYTIRGASPGLAVVAAVNPAPGSPSVFELAVGDAVPGLGHVKRVYQRGTSWAVDTDGGTIQ